MNISTRFLRTLLSTVLLLLSATAFAIPTPTSLVVFGDSLSNTGNNGAPAPYAPGRFSNGGTYVDVLADIWGVSSLNSLAGGTNYAYGGATIDDALNTSVPGLQSQASTYLSSTGGVADANALYIVFGGGNDLRAIASGAPFSTLSDSANALAGIVADLDAAGAQNILIPNIPNLGLTPSADGNEPTATFVTTALNANIVNAVNDLNLSANVIFFDAFGFTDSVIADPAAFGFTNVDDPCFDQIAGTVCANPDQYLFWDGLHPTAAGHEFLGNAIAAQVVPIPAALPLMASALGLLGVVARRRRQA